MDLQCDYIKTNCCPCVGSQDTVHRNRVARHDLPKSTEVINEITKLLLFCATERSRICISGGVSSTRRTTSTRRCRLSRTSSSLTRPSRRRTTRRRRRARCTLRMTRQPGTTTRRRTRCVRLHTFSVTRQLVLS